MAKKIKQLFCNKVQQDAWDSLVARVAVLEEKVNPAPKTKPARKEVLGEGVQKITPMPMPTNHVGDKFVHQHGTTTIVPKEDI